MEQGTRDQKPQKSEKAVAEQDILKLQEFIKKLGGVERAKLAVEELARLRKAA